MSSASVPVAAPVHTLGFGSAPAPAGRAVVEREQGFTVAVSPNPMDRQLDFWTSYDGSKPEHRDLVLKAMSSNVQRGSEYIGKPFEVCNAVCHPVEMENDKTGEVSQEIRMVLIGPNDEMISFVSRGAFKALGLICRLYSTLPWNPPKTLLVTQYTTRKSYRSYDITVVNDQPAQPATGRKRV